MAEKSSFAHHAIGKMALGALAAGATVAVASVKMASDFQSAMELIHSQAGASQAEVNKMSGAVLALAGPTATAPAELAAGLYHLESAGLRGQKALDALKTAALGAKVGQANLEEVTNALNATIASGIPGSQNMNQAMGALNATVGAGDMRMSDLAEAFGTGFLATVKGFGVTLNDAGAALATFGDNNIRGADAATQLRMAVLFMAKPAAGAAEALGKIGLKTTTLAKDMQTGGLNKAITDLHDHLEKAGYTGNKAGEILLDAFGHKAGTGLSVLVGQYGRFESKIEEVRKGSEGFGESVKATTHTFAFQWAAAKAAGEAFFIRLGTVLLPLATAALSGISKAFSTVSNVITGVWGVISGSGAAENHLKGFSSGVQITLIKLGGHIRDAMKVASEAFHRISGVVAPLLPVLEKFGQTVLHGVVDHLRALASAVRSDVWPVLEKFGKTVAGSIVTDLKALVSVVRDDVWPSLQNLWRFLSPVLIDALKMVATVVMAVVIVAFKALAPVLQGLGTALKATTGFLAQHKTAIQATAIILGVLLAPLLASTVAMKAQAVATVVMTTVQKGLAVVTKAWAAAQWLLNAALDANPIGLAAIAVAALAAGFIYAYKHSETFRNIVKGAMHGVMVAIDFVKDHWKAFVMGFAFLVAGPFGVAIVLLVTHFQTVKRVGEEVFVALAKAAIDMGKWMFDAMTAPLRGFLEVVAKIPGPWRGAARSALKALRDVDAQLAASNKALDEFLRPRVLRINVAMSNQLKAGGVSSATRAGFSRGGFVHGGVQGRDSVPAMLMPGEFVVREDRSNLGDLLTRHIPSAPAAVMPSTGGAGGDVYVDVTVNAGAGADGKDIAREIQSVLLNLKRTTGRSLGLA